jgi:DNA polymerase III delta prime subunit
MIFEYLDKNNLHHAYLIEGKRDEIVPEVLEFLKTLNINTIGNPDFVQISIDNFKIEEAFDLRSMSTDKSFSLGHSSTGEASSKKVFLICVNSFSLDAQNVLLKMFEEPIEDTHFFLVVPDVNALLKTLVSRFYVISTRQDLAEENKQAKKFITLPLKNRLDFIKELLAEEEEEDEEGNEIVALDSSRSKALKFLNALEVTLPKTVFDTKTFEHIFKVREFLRIPGSSTKSLMESVALIIPEKI